MRGDTNIKGHVFVSCLCGQIEALQKATSTEEGIINEARKSVDHCLRLMTDKYKGQEAQISAEANPGLSMNPGLNGVDWDAMVSVFSCIQHVDQALILYRCKIRMPTSNCQVNGSSLDGRMVIF